ncbi:hypothetical protein CK203_064841 [Vitis vinifera]|nr:hypothetical protein CK203_064841 [Vitis vinifera]
MTRSFKTADEIWFFSPSSLSSDEVANAFNSIQQSGNPSEDVFNSFQKSVDSTFKWTVVASIFSSVVVVVAVVAVVLALIDCLKKTGTAIPKFARISSKDDDEPFNKTSMEDTQKVQDAVPSGYP